MVNFRWYGEVKKVFYLMCPLNSNFKTNAVDRVRCKLFTVFTKYGKYKNHENGR